MGKYADEYIDNLMDFPNDNFKYYRHKPNKQRKQKQGELMLIRGTGKWVKVLGEPVWGYENKHKEWSFDVYIDEETAHKLEVNGLKDKIKDKGNGQYMTFKRREFKQDGTPNQPIRVVDHHGELWNPKVRIGNGSTLNVNFAINEYGKNQKSANVLAIQVWDLVPYEGSEFPTKDDAEGGGWAEEVAAETEAN